MSTLIHSWDVPAQTGTGPTTGLNFPSLGDSPSSAFVAFQFLNPQNDGLPFVGPSNQGNTFLWKYMPRQQNGYYATMWWSRGDGSFDQPSGSQAYYGAHPYPPGGAGTSAHNWEIAYATLDEQNTLAGSPKSVVNDIFFSQALKVTQNGSNQIILRFYINLPSVANADIIQVTTAAGYGDTLPSSPALTFGDSPWYPEYGHERLSGVLRGLKIFNNALSEADIVSEAGSDDLVTSAGIANIWYKKVNPDPNNMLCEAGTGRNPAWAQATHATLWTPP